VQEVPGSNPGSPTKFLKELQRLGSPKPGLWSPTVVQNLVPWPSGERVFNSSLPLTSWLFADFAFPSKSLAVFPSALFSWENPTFPTNRFQPIGRAGTTRVGSVHFPAIEPDKRPCETRQTPTLLGRLTRTRRIQDKLARPGCRHSPKRRLGAILQVADHPLRAATFR